MHIARTPTELTAALAEARAGGRTLGFVPTMGALHAGHRALIDAAAADCDAVAVSIFVNPLQFGANEDFSRYPRDEAYDLALAERAGCRLVWLPDLATMYPPDTATQIEVQGPALGWEGSVRPGHFRGVATVVARLFGQLQADRAYFGEKDWQQLQVVRRMTLDLALPTRIVPVATVREADGLALSSRNRYLTAAERALAPMLFSAMHRAAVAIGEGAAVADVLGDSSARLLQAGLVPDYFALVDAASLAARTHAAPDARLIAAARLGTIRLLDNIAVD